MSLDGMVPARLARFHPKWKTPHIITRGTGTGVALGLAFPPVGKLADVTNAAQSSPFIPFVSNADELSPLVRGKFTFFRSISAMDRCMRSIWSEQ